VEDEEAAVAAVVVVAVAVIVADTKAAAAEEVVAVADTLVVEVEVDVEVTSRICQSAPAHHSRNTHITPTPTPPVALRWESISSTLVKHLTRQQSS